jgi:hypothetical protein
MGCVKEAPKLKNMFSVVLRNVVLLYPCIGTRKSSTLSMEKQQKEGKYQERRMGCAKETEKKLLKKYVKCM